MSFNLHVKSFSSSRIKLLRYKVTNHIQGYTYTQQMGMGVRAWAVKAEMTPKRSDML